MEKFLKADAARGVRTLTARGYRTPTVAGECSPLWLAARAACIGRGVLTSAAMLLLEEDTDTVNAVGQDRGGASICTPLMWAARAVYVGATGGLELARLLLEKGADVNAVGKLWDADECTPLCVAARAVRDHVEDGLELVRLLVSEGAHLADGEGDFQPHVDSILGAWVNRPHARNEHFELTQSSGRHIECCVCLEEVTRREALVLGACGHKMCVQCYARMLTDRTKDKCPSCRYDGAPADTRHAPRRRLQ